MKLENILWEIDTAKEAGPVSIGRGENCLRLAFIQTQRCGLKTIGINWSWRQEMVAGRPQHKNMLCFLSFYYYFDRIQSK